ncbi:zinc-binding dehydrogenase [Actinokineospora sp. NPDC004072]
MPFADTSTHLLPTGLSAESALMLSDILPTAFEVGVLNGAVAPGDTVAIVGAGPIGLAAIATARLFSPGAIIAIDPAAPRRDAAKRFGADMVVDTATDPTSVVMARTDGLGADVVIEAAG